MESLTLAAIRVNKQMSTEEMAKAMNVSADRWRRLESGETKMTALEFIEFHKLTGVPYENINLNPAKED